MIENNIKLKIKAYKQYQRWLKPSDRNRPQYTVGHVIDILENILEEEKQEKKRRKQNDYKRNPESIPIQSKKSRAD